MASFYAELTVAGATYPVRQCEFAFTQATDQRGRVQAKVRHGQLHLTLDVPTTGQLLDWAATPHKPLAGHVTFFNTSPRTPRETVSFAAGECVSYAEMFRAGSDGDGAYVCQLTIASEQLTLASGGATPAATDEEAAAPTAAAAPAAPGAGGMRALAAVAAGAAAVAGLTQAVGSLALGGKAAAVPNPANSGKTQVLAYAGFGGDIITNPTRTTTVLGKFIDPVVPGTGTSEVLKMPEGTFTRGAENLGGLNILDLPSKEYEELLTTFGEEQGKQLFWDNHNQPFLEEAFAGGHEVRLLSDPQDARNRTGFYERELQAMEGTTDAATGQRTPGLAEKYGYQYNPATATYLPPVPTPPPPGGDARPPLAAKLPSPVKIRSRL